MLGGERGRCRRRWWWEEKDLGMREWLGLRTSVIMKVEGAGNKCDDADDRRDAAAAAAAADQNDDRYVRVRGPAVDSSLCLTHPQLAINGTTPTKSSP